MVISHDNGNVARILVGAKGIQNDKKNVSMFLHILNMYLSTSMKINMFIDAKIDNNLQQKNDTYSVFDECFLQNIMSNVFLAD